MRGLQRSTRTRTVHRILRGICWQRSICRNRRTHRMAATHRIRRRRLPIQLTIRPRSRITTAG
jgi:hypothetical protein